MNRILGALVGILALNGCVGTADDDTLQGVEDEAVDTAVEAMNPAGLYYYGAFGGNGRTCGTCHPVGTGTFNPAQAKARYAANPNDPLFRPMDSDDGTGSSYKRLLTEATVVVNIDLPPNVKLASDPSATSIALYRGTPSTVDIPALDPVLMWDGRAASLEEQAAGAILGHAQAPKLPGANDIAKIIQFEKGFFSSATLKNYASGGPAPVLPDGNTLTEKRGRKWFDTTVPTGICAHCHSGPMLNETNQYNVFGLPPGERFITAFVSELNPAERPLSTYLFTKGDGSKITVTTPDPGRR